MSLHHTKNDEFLDRFVDAVENSQEPKDIDMPECDRPEEDHLSDLGEDYTDHLLDLGLSASL